MAKGQEIYLCLSFKIISEEQVLLCLFWRKREDSIRRTNPNTCTIFEQMAEARGFEPPRRLTRPHDFESCAFNHSATLPPLFYHIFTIITTQTRKICYNINVTLLVMLI